MMRLLAEQPALTASLATAARTLLGLVFLQAFAGKLADPARLAGTIADYRLLPRRLARPAALLLLPAEALAATALLAADLLPGRLALPGAGLAAALLALFVASMAINLARGRRHISCGCHAAPTPLSWTQVGRSASLLAAALVAAAPVAPAPTPAGLLLSAQAVAAGLLLWVLFHTSGTLPLPRRTARP